MHYFKRTFLFLLLKILWDILFALLWFWRSHYAYLILSQSLIRINKIDQNVNHATIPLKGKEGRGKGCRISNLMSHIRMFWFTREWYDKEHIPYNLAFDNCTFSQMIFASEDETATTTTYAKVKSYRYSIFLMIG